MTKATGSNELVERLREGVQALYHEPGQSTPIYAIVPANQTMRKAADRITDLEARLARAAALVAKLDECKPYIDSAFFQMANHGMPHTGPQYGEELKALRAALKEAKDAN